MEKNQNKRKGLALFKWLRLIFTVGIEILASYFAWMIRYSRHPERYPLSLRYGKVHKLAYSLSKKLRLQLDENVSSAFKSLQRSTLVVSNHLSICDIVFLLALAEDPITFIAKKETANMPFIGKCLKAIDGYFLDRGDPKQAVRLFMKIGKAMKEKRMTLVVYPEGTRLKDPFSEVGEFHAGTFKLLEWGKADLLPVAGFGSFRPLSKSEHESSFPVELHALKLVPCEESKGKNTVELAAEARNEIESEVASMRRFDQEFYAQGLNKKKAGKWWKK
ncbi:MAG: lysophospholipid acyltransferase family protein [Candidatus Enteromonas sp.]|nr:1-acyl-sn-glycerol-3-phosphate acyltransferase [bacterium]MDD6917206.1 lysophospholipid acyltransferase family protein [bacterium]MDY6100961.1 lysophospholipid acyltransferase family protein [Candidatus Enteromonas sp.]